MSHVVIGLASDLLESLFQLGFANQPDIKGLPKGLGVHWFNLAGGVLQVRLGMPKLRVGQPIFENEAGKCIVALRVPVATRSLTMPWRLGDGYFDIDLELSNVFDKDLEVYRLGVSPDVLMNSVINIPLVDSPSPIVESYTLSEFKGALDPAENPTKLITKLLNVVSVVLTPQSEGSGSDGGVLKELNDFFADPAAALDLQKRFNGAIPPTLFDMAPTFLPAMPGADVSVNKLTKIGTDGLEGSSQGVYIEFDFRQKDGSPVSNPATSAYIGQLEGGFGGLSGASLGSFLQAGELGVGLSWPMLIWHLRSGLVLEPSKEFPDYVKIKEVSGFPKAKSLMVHLDVEVDLSTFWVPLPSAWPVGVDFELSASAGDILIANVDVSLGPFLYLVILVLLNAVNPMGFWNVNPLAAGFLELAIGDALDAVIGPRVQAEATKQVLQLFTVDEAFPGIIPVPVAGTAFLARRENARIAVIDGDVLFAVALDDGDGGTPSSAAAQAELRLPPEPLPIFSSTLLQKDQTIATGPLGLLRVVESSYQVTLGCVQDYSDRLTKNIYGDMAFSSSVGTNNPPWVDGTFRIVDKSQLKDSPLTLSRQMSVNGALAASGFQMNPPWDIDGAISPLELEQTFGGPFEVVVEVILVCDPVSKASTLLDIFGVGLSAEAQAIAVAVLQAIIAEFVSEPQTIRRGKKESFYFLSVYRDSPVRDLVGTHRFLPWERLPTAEAIVRWVEARASQVSRLASRSDSVESQSGHLGRSLSNLAEAKRSKGGAEK